MVLQVSILFLLMSGLSCLSSTAGEPSSNSESDIDSSLYIDNEFASDSETDVKSSLYVGNPQHEIKLDKYFNLTELDELIGDLCEEYPSLVKVRSLGLSEEHNTTVRGVEISHDVQEERKLLKPMVQLVANYHPDDAVAYAMMVSLIQYLVHSDGYDDDITRMLNTTDIWIIPIFNLDSLKKSAQISYNISTITKAHQNEPWNSQEISDLKDNPFVISANIQGATPTKLKNSKNYYEPKYPTRMQKYNYYYHNSLKISANINCSKNVTASELPKYWDANLESMLKLIESVHRGVYGLVKDIEGKTIQGAIIKQKGPFQSIRVTEAGEYWLLLPLGKSYNITASAWAHIEETKEVAVTNEEPYVRVDFVLNYRRIYGTVRDKEGNLIPDSFVHGTQGCDMSGPSTVGGRYSFLFDFKDTGANCALTASAPGYIKETKPVHLTKDEPNVNIDFILDQARVYGVVKDANSNPVQEAVITKVEIVRFISEFGKKRTVKLEETSTGVNEQGEYSMPLAKLEIFYQLIISAPGFRTKKASVFATRKDPHIQLDFKLRRPFEILKCSGN